MRILVTGAVGNVGPAVVERLAAAGHFLRVIGRRPDMRVAGAEYAQCDITDMAGLRTQVKGMEAIVHLAALGNPSVGSPEEVFRINCAGSCNVYEAAAGEGIRRVVSASSINALGFGFGVRDFTVHYLPIDEEHPTTPTDAYSFSKNVLEDIADFYWRRDGISGACLRLPAVIPDAGYGEEAVRASAAACRAEVEMIMSLSPARRAERLAGLKTRLMETRANRWFEHAPAGWQGPCPESPLMMMRSDFWTGLHARDGAQAVDRALFGDYEGSHVMFIIDSHNRTGVPSRTLAELFYPEVTTWKRPVDGTATLVSIDRARALLGFEPEYSAARFLE